MRDYTLDKPMILERLGGDEEIFMVMVDMFLQDAENYGKALRDAYTARQQSTVQREAHTIKGLLASFGDDPGTQAALAIEMKAKTGDLSDLEAPIQELDQRIHHVADFLKRELGL